MLGHCIDALRTSRPFCAAVKAFGKPQCPAHVRFTSSKGGSSSRYLARQKRDVYVRERSEKSAGGEMNYASRSAFKLEQLDAQFKFLSPGRVVVDLGAAPGGWTQVAAKKTLRGKPSINKLESGGTVFALDRLPMAEVPGATSIQGDFLDTTVQAQLAQLVRDRLSRPKDRTQPEERVESVEKIHNARVVDVVLSDMMANTSGNMIRDSEASLDLCRAAFEFARTNLKVDPPVEGKPSKKEFTKQATFVCKYFMSQEAEEFRKEILERAFRSVRSEKMPASRSESRERFWLCRGFIAPGV